MKKTSLLALLMSLLLLMSALTGCGSPASGTSPTPSAPAAPSATPSATPEPAPVPKRIAIIFDGTITDNGWNQDGYTEITKLSQERGFELSYQENVSSNDAADVIRNYANDGYDMVIDNEQYHCEIMAEIAPEFPNVVFACVNGYVSAENMIAITGDMWQHVYLAGLMAGEATKSDKIGLITYSTNSKSALTMLAAYGAGAKAANDKVEVVHVATGSFSDLAIGKEMATSLIDQGCDVIFCNSGDCNATVYQTAAERGVYAIGAIVDHNAISADYMLGSAMLPPSNIIRIMVDGFLDGTMKGSSTVKVMGLKEGAEEFRVNPTMKGKFDQAVFDQINKATDDIVAGKITITLP